MFATCPHCRAPIRMPVGGQEFLCPKCGMLVGNANALTSAQMDRLTREQIGRANQNMYTPALLRMAGFVAIPAVFLSQRTTFAPILGWDEPPSWLAYVLWTVLLLIVAALGTAFSNLTSSLIYWRKSGRMYVQDRVGYARSGGIDIAIWAPVVAIAVLLGVLAGTYGRPDGDPVSFLRWPWLFAAICFLLAPALAALAALLIMHPRRG